MTTAPRTTVPSTTVPGTTPPRTLVVTAHPDPDSLTHRAAACLQDLLGPGASSSAHLAQEGFDPRFTLADRRTYVGAAAVDPAVRAEQERLDAVTDVVLVFPVYWWSFPALLKGWVDRVFLAGWAFTYGEAGTIVPRLQRLRVHLLPVAGASAESFDRHGYRQSLHTQVERGILDFCGAARGATAFVHDSEDGEGTAAAVGAAAATIAAAITAGAVGQEAPAA